MAEWISWLQEHALEAGPGGVFLLSVVDAAGIPTGGGPDVAVALLTSLRGEPAFAAGLVLAAVTGSLIGCGALYWVGLRGGAAAGRRFAPEALENARGRLDRHGAWIIFLALLIPPVPAKVFVVGAGIAAMPVLRFLGGVALGRIVRYSFNAWLALRFGPQALEIVQAHTWVAWLLLVPPVLLLSLALVRRARSKRPERPAA